jgi:ketosteroid isomerase-like protein
MRPSGKRSGAFWRSGGPFEPRHQKTIRSPDIALRFSQWRLAGADPNGNAVELAGQTTAVVRRQADGCWLLAVDNPYGAAGAAV